MANSRIRDAGASWAGVAGAAGAGAVRVAGREQPLQEHDLAAVKIGSDRELAGAFCGPRQRTLGGPELLPEPDVLLGQLAVLGHAVASSYSRPVTVSCRAEESPRPASGSVAASRRTT